VEAPRRLWPRFVEELNIRRTARLGARQRIPCNPCRFHSKALQCKNPRAVKVYNLP